MNRPNLLLIMDDQHRFDYLGCAGAGFVHTPNLDRLAARGVRFTHCGTNAPVCAPARIALSAGLRPHRLGALNNNSFLPRRVPTYYQRLCDHGYRVGCVGKLDLAKPEPDLGRHGDRPCVFGWGFTHPEECEGKMSAGVSPTPRGPYTHYLRERGLLRKFYEDYKARRAKGWILGASHDSVLPADAFEDAYIGRRAVEWIETIANDFPWYLFVSFVGPHDPFDPPREYAERCRSREVPPAISDDLSGKPAWWKHRHVQPTSEQLAQTRRQYSAAIELIDEWVGRIVATLDKRGQLETTCILFVSDHGEMLGDHGLYQKSVPYEAALRVPLIAAGPGIERGRVNDSLIELIDLNATLCELAGLPAQDRMDARSFAPILRGMAETHREEIVSVLQNFRLIRTARYKFIENFNDRNELYDLQDDPNELNNIIEREQEEARALAARMRACLMEGQWRR